MACSVLAPVAIAGARGRGGVRRGAAPGGVGSALRRGLRRVLRALHRRAAGLGRPVLDRCRRPRLDLRRCRNLILPPARLPAYERVPRPIGRGTREVRSLQVACSYWPPSRTKVISMLTLYPTMLPFSIMTFMSL